MPRISVIISLQVIASGNSLRFSSEQFSERLPNYMQIKTKQIENKIIFEDFNCAMDKRERDGENKAQIIYWFRFNYALSKLIESNELEDLWRKKNPDSSELSHYDRSSGTRSRIDGFSSDHYNTISIDKLPSKTKTG